ncbi:hypothetical protein WN944_007150 [Citrus x changshan-huyou]|uniref:Uncharacterized protein n=1 Tax=Citrus x changshan-huyou TaxID=2935761 RepID=A0AAP0QXT1_9ROSI
MRIGSRLASTESETEVRDWMDIYLSPFRSQMRWDCIKTTAPQRQAHSQTVSFLSPYDLAFQKVFFDGSLVPLCKEGDVLTSLTVPTIISGFQIPLAVLL